MAPSRLWLIALAFWGVDLLLLALFPGFRVFADPLLLFLVFSGLTLSSGRLLWAVGAGLGLAKDLGVGGLFGAWGCVFALIGWILGSSRHLIESEDPAAGGILTGILTGVSFLAYAGLIALAEGRTFWGSWWVTLPLAMGINGGLATWIFPKLTRMVRRRSRLSRSASRISL